MSRRLPNRLALILGVLLVVIPQESFAQRYGGRPHGWHGGGGHGYQRGYGGRYRYGGNVAYHGYRGYGGYPGYYGYGGYVGYPRYYGYGGYYGHHHHDNDGVWIALGAGVLGLLVGSALARPRYYQYAYPSAPPPPPPPPAAPAMPATPRCQDGSPVPPGGYCTAPPSEGERG